MTITDQQKKILELLADGEFHSGPVLADILGVSRSAVWKQLHNLTELGLEPIAVSGKGYRLKRPIEFLSSEKIESVLMDNVRLNISDLNIHDRLDSTNNHLINLAKCAARSGTVCLAEFQIAGKGRRGRSWVSPFGSNIYLSLLWHFHNGPSAISGLSLAVGVSVIRALASLGLSGIGLKWPNDIYWQEHKLGGILIEVTGETHGPCAAVIGIGLNIYIPDREAAMIDQAWIDLTRIMGGISISRNRLVGTLLNELLPILADYENHGLAPYLDEWRSYDCLVGHPVVIYQGESAITGNAGGIDDNGLFRLMTADGKACCFASGEVSFSKN